MGKAGAGKRSEKRPLLQTGIGKALFGLLVLAVCLLYTSDAADE